MTPWIPNKQAKAGGGGVNSQLPFKKQNRLITKAKLIRAILETLSSYENANVDQD